MTIYSGLLLWVFCIISSNAYAADNMLFYGSLTEPPPCSINDGDYVDVDFGNQVGVNKVDGVNYLRPVNYQINCDQNTDAGNMTLEIIGVRTDYDNAALRTNVADLGIKIFQNDYPFEINKPIQISLANKPILKAVPVKRPGSMLSERSFEATATLLAAYQ